MKKKGEKILRQILRNALFIFMFGYEKFIFRDPKMSCGVNQVKSINTFSLHHLFMRVYTS